MHRSQKFGPGGSRAAMVTNFQQIGLRLFFGDLPFGLSLGITFQQSGCGGRMKF